MVNNKLIYKARKKINRKSKKSVENKLGNKFTKNIRDLFSNRI